MIVDTQWDGGYSVIVLVPVTEDITAWHGTVTFSHTIVSANVSAYMQACFCNIMTSSILGNLEQSPDKIFTVVFNLNCKY